MTNVYYKYLGWGTTDDDGIAQLEYDAEGNHIEGYVGVGAGEIDIITSIDSVITENSIISQPSSFIDGLLADIGLRAEGMHNDNALVYNSAHVDLVRDDTGTTVTNNDTSSFRTLTSKNPSTNNYLWNGGLTIEVDILSGSDDVRVNLYTANGETIRKLSELGLTTGGHLKIVYNGTTAIYYVDGQQAYSSSVTLTDYQIRFAMPSNTSFKYKNFVIHTPTD